MDLVEDKHERWPVESSSRHFQGRVISVRRDIVCSPVDESTFAREVVEHPGAVAAVALDDDDNVLVVSQYRHPVGQRLIEIPAGLKDVPGEPPHECAARELFEEGHVRAGDWRMLIDTFSSPGITNEAVQIFLARDIAIVPDDQRHNGEHEEADMPVYWVPLDDLVAKIFAGEIHNSLACIGVLATWAAKQRPGGFDALRVPTGVVAAAGE